MARGDFQLVTHPELAPACDFLTRSTVGPFVDTGVDVLLRPAPGKEVQRERVYIAVSTIASMAKMAGIGGTDVTSGREEELIAKGKLEGLKEGLGDDMVDVARTLRRWLDAAGVGDDGMGDTSSL